MVPFAGWSMPVQYSGILEEHRAVRETAGLFDVSHMGEAEVTGPEAVAFLDRLLTNDISRLTPGRALYAMMCQDDGGVVDDVIVNCLAPDRFLICLNASNAKKDIEWMQQYVGDFQCTLVDRSPDYGLLALQGPHSREILQPLLDLVLADLKRFRVAEVKLEGFDVLVSHTGYTGEEGFELYLPTEATLPVAERLLETGEQHGLKLIGLGARDSLRLEAGLPLYGHEIGPEINPLEAGLGFFVKLNKPARFIGQEALRKVQAEGPRRQLIHFILEDRRIAREGAPVLSGETPVGAVASGTLSPMLQKPIGSALISREADTAQLTVDIRGRQIPMQVMKPPLHKHVGA